MTVEAVIAEAESSEASEVTKGAVRNFTAEVGAGEAEDGDATGLADDSSPGAR